MRHLFEFATGMSELSKLPESALDKIVWARLTDARATLLGNRCSEVAPLHCKRESLSAV